MKEQTLEAHEVRDNPVLQVAHDLGLDPALSYSIPNCEKIMGISRRAIRAARDRGEIKTYMPCGSERGERMLLGELERWFIAHGGVCA